jgi:hypothetical protein
LSVEHPGRPKGRDNEARDAPSNGGKIAIGKIANGKSFVFQSR